MHAPVLDEELNFTVECIDFFHRSLPIISNYWYMAPAIMKNEHHRELSRNVINFKLNNKVAKIGKIPNWKFSFLF